MCRATPSLLLLVLAACAPPRDDAVDPGTCGGAGQPACAECTTPAECNARCGGGACSCVEGACVARICSADAECAPGLLCAAGACGPAAADSEVRACVVAPRHLLVREGDRVRVHVTATGEGGRALRTGPPAFTLDGLGATMDAGGVVTGGATPGGFEIEAAIGAARCTADGVGLGAPPPALRVTVVDELTGLPVPGALVRVEDGGAGRIGTTGADGAAVIDPAPAEPRTISVFAEQRGYLTVAGVEGSDLLLPLRRLPAAGRRGGYEGAFQPPELFGSTSSLQLGLAGTSIPGDLLDISLPRLLGPVVRVIVPIGNGFAIDVPTGVALGLGRTWFKQWYGALGEPGLCADPARDGSGECGLRTAWGLAGGIPLSAVPAELLQGRTVDTGELLASILPASGSLRSAVVRDVAFDLVPDAGGLPDTAAFTELDLRAEMPLSLTVPVTVPPLPAGERPLPFVLALGGVRDRDRGLVPLGITAGRDRDPRDGTVDGDLALRMAPAHGGLETGDYATIVLAFDPAADGTTCTIADDRRCASASALVVTSAALADGKAVTFEGPFLPPPAHTTWSPAGRTFSGAGAGGSPTLLRVVFRARGGQTWTLFLAPGTASLPAPPAGLVDPLLDPDLSLTVQSMRARVGLSELAAGREASMLDLLPQLAAFSSIDRPL